jgi:hypothetical protein
VCLSLIVTGQLHWSFGCPPQVYSLIEWWKAHSLMMCRSALLLLNKVESSRIYSTDFSVNKKRLLFLYESKSERSGMGRSRTYLIKQMLLIQQFIQNDEFSISLISYNDVAPNADYRLAWIRKYSSYGEESSFKVFVSL